MAAAAKLRGRELTKPQLRKLVKHLNRYSIRIGLTGRAGAGKTELEPRLSAALGDIPTYQSTLKSLKGAKGYEDLTEEEIAREARKDPHADHKIDYAALQKMKKSKGPIIMFGRMAPFLTHPQIIGRINDAIGTNIKYSDVSDIKQVNIALKAKRKIIGERVYLDPARESEKFLSPKDAAQRMTARDEKDRVALRQAYGKKIKPFDFDNRSIFHVVVDTTGKSKEQVLSETLYKMYHHFGLGGKKKA
jgi:cytidylate kinase